MTNLDALLIAERRRQIRVNAAPRCCGSPTLPRVRHELRLPWLVAWWRPRPAVC